MTLRISRLSAIRHRLIKLRVKKWLFPFVCSLPYLLSLVWLCFVGQSWIAQIMLAPLLMTLLLSLLSLFLARLEFRGKLY